MSTVMVVDDEERIRSLLSRSLSTEGHSVVSAADGQGAMERLSRGGVDLVLLDLVMPGSGGLGVLATMQDRGDTTPVIVLSAVSEVVARVRRHLTSRPAPQREHRYLEAGGIRLDLDRRRAELGGREVGLTEREF